MLASTGVEMNLGADPELRFTPQGKAVCNMRGVTSRRRRNPQTEEWEDVDTTWYELTAWERLAENIAESDLKSGMRVIVLGKIHHREWEDRDGNKRYTLCMTVDAIGPSLAFATATVKKVERVGGSSSSGGTGQAQRSSAPPQDDPWATPPQDDEPPF
jgi:single-strand DNA-binding protein